MARLAASLLVLALTLPVFAQPVAWTDAPVAGRIESKVLGQTRTFLVRTPRSYPQGSTNYPVIYLSDGDHQMPHLAAVADFLAREGRMPEVILVGISNIDRTHDLTPTPVVDTVLDGQRFHFPTSGGAPDFLRFIETELIPRIEKDYRTMPYRVFAGHSFGGLFALHTLFSRPRLFNAVIAVSPSLHWDDRYVYRAAEKFVAANRELDTTLFVSMGDEGKVLDDELKALTSLFKKRGPKGFTFQSVVFKDEDHGSIVLPTHYAGLRKVFEPWRFRAKQGEDPKAMNTRLREHFEQLSKLTGQTMPVPEPLRNLAGYRFLQAERVKEAIEVFRENVAAYPRSPNVYDSLGEAYERAGDKKSAHESYARAAELGRSVNDPNTRIFEANRDRVKP
jgi:uncharacterized protein